MKITNHKNTNATLKADRDDMFALFEAATKTLERELKEEGANNMMKERMESQLEEWTNLLEEMRGQ